MVYFDRSVPIKPSEFKTSISVESYNEKTTENYRNGYVVEKRIVSKLSEISIPNFNSTNWRLECIFFQYFTSLYFILS